MRRKKHKATRRALRFYRISHGFRQPYKVLLDGNFVHALQEMRKGDAKDLIFRLLGDAVKCYTTPCVQGELKKLGKDFNGARQALKQFPLHKCGHEERCSAAECLLAQLGDKNEEHFFVATQDKALQRQCMAVPGGAVLFASVNGLHLEQPSALQRQAVAAKEQQQLVPSQAERRSVALAGAEGEAGQPRDRPLFRRHKAKGPNPLAVRKKQKLTNAATPGGGGAQQQQQPQPQQQQRPALQKTQQMQQKRAAAAGSGGEQQQEKRKRARRRSKGGEGGAAAGGGSD